MSTEPSSKRVDDGNGRRRGGEGTGKARRRRTRRSDASAVADHRAKKRKRKPSKRTRDDRRRRTRERHLEAPEWAKVDTLLKLLAYALATSDPKKRWRRFMAVLLTLVATIVIVLAAAVATLWLMPNDSILIRVVFSALGIGMTGIGVAGARSVHRSRRGGGADPREALE